MQLKEIAIRNFRNLKSLELKFSSGINLIWGENAQGKSNVLEAIYCLLMGRTFRTKVERECLPWPPQPDQVALVKGLLNKAGVNHKITYALSRDDKKITYDAKPVARLLDYWGEANVVLFYPEDLFIVKGPPAERRRLIDIDLSQRHRPYLLSLRKFHDLLRQRNILLKADQPPEQITKELEAWDEQLAEEAATIFSFRYQLVQDLSARANKYFLALTNELEQLEIEYQNFLNENAPLSQEEAKEIFINILIAVRDEDLSRGITTVGPQRDDLLFKVNGMDIRTFGSQAQQRSCMLALRLAEMNIFEQEKGEPPILLLDDVASELDQQRQQKLFDLLSTPTQAIITAVSYRQIASRAKINTAYQITNGSVRKEKDDNL